MNRWARVGRFKNDYEYELINTYVILNNLYWSLPNWNPEILARFIESPEEDKTLEAVTDKTKVISENQIDPHALGLDTWGFQQRFKLGFKWVWRR